MAEGDMYLPWSFMRVMEGNHVYCCAVAEEAMDVVEKAVSRSPCWSILQEHPN